MTTNLARLAPLLVLVSGCFWATTKSEGDRLRRDVTALQDRIGSKEKELGDQVAQLKQVLDDATKLLKRNSADLGAEIESLRGELRASNGQITTMANTVAEVRSAIDAYRKRLDAIEQRLAALEGGRPVPGGGAAGGGGSADELWRQGSAAFEAAKYAEAIDLFKRLHQSFPTHERADDAIYFKGQAYTNLKEWEKAIGAYQQLGEKFPDGALTDDGYYFAALAAQRLKQCTEARAYVNIIKTRFKKSNVTKAADELDAQLKKDAKTKSKCSA